MKRKDIDMAFIDLIRNPTKSTYDILMSCLILHEDVVNLQDLAFYYRISVRAASENCDEDIFSEIINSDKNRELLEAFPDLLSWLHSEKMQAEKTTQ